MSGLKQLIYTSQSEMFADLKKMQRLLVQSRENNLKREITGALLQDQQSIIQVLEGAADSVNALFAKILRDPRHCDVVLIMERPIAEREFGEWSMGYAAGVGATESEPNSFTDLFSGVVTPLRPRSRAARVLAHFAEGGWH